MYWIQFVLYFGIVGATLKRSHIFTGNIKDDHQLELKDWQDLLFPDGQSPLDDSIESSSMSEEKEDDAFQNYVFRTRFSSRQEQSTHSAHRIDRKTAEFFADELAVSIENEWLGSQVKDFSLKVLRLNLTIHDMKIISLEFPKIRFERRSPNMINLIASDGHLIINGKYTSVYRTTRRGKIEVSAKGLNLDLKLRFQRSESCVPYLIEMECRPTIQKIDLNFKPFLLNEVEDAVQQHLWTSIQEELCSRSEDYLQITDDKFRKLGL